MRTVILGACFGLEAFLLFPKPSFRGFIFIAAQALVVGLVRQEIRNGR